MDKRPQDMDSMDGGAHPTPNAPNAESAPPAFEYPRIFAKFFSPVGCVAVSPDGQRIVVGLANGLLQLRDLEGNPIGDPFKGHSNSVGSVAFSPDGSRIVSGSSDQTLRLWDLEGNPIGDPFKGHSNAVLSVAFSPDGSRIVSGSSDETLRLWPVIRHRLVPESVANDLAQGNDALQVQTELEAMAEVLLLRTLQPPLAVGLFGNWGSGKSFAMHLIQSRINHIRSHPLRAFQTWNSDPSHSYLSPSVGHIYQIQFNCWTYAKSNLWASLMQEIFYELNRQISLEQQLAKILSASVSSEPQSINQTSAHQDTQDKHSLRLIDCAIYNPIKALKQFAMRFIWQPFKYLILKIIQPLDLLLITVFLHLTSFIWLGLLWLVLIFLYYVLPFPIKRLDKYIDGPLAAVPEFIEDKVRDFAETISLEKLSQTQFNYYWINIGERKYSRVEIVIERLIFFLFVGFPTRWLDRYRWWKQRFQQFPWIEPEKTSQDSAISDDQRNEQMSAALREGGKFWKALYTLNEEERNLLIRAKLGKQKFEDWQKAVSSESDISNYLWSALDRLRTDEQTLLQTTKTKLKEKETQLQRQIERAEVDVHKKLTRRTWSAFWTPVLHALASLKFSEDDIKSFSAAGQNGQLFRKTINSWQGFLALVLLGAVLAFSFTSDDLSSLLDQFTSWLNKEKLRGEAQFWITVITSTLVTLLPTLKALDDYITAVQKEQAQIKSDQETLLEEARTQDSTLIQEINQLKLQVREQKERIGLTASHSSLMDFVTARLDEESYGQHLGLMQQVRQDLQDLSNRLTPGSHNMEQLKTLFPRGPARVVLYIDDLDRCPPNRVIEVLEAIQLLLKTELFIVVLAIDDRYIARALEQVYKGVLTRHGSPSGIDYLEKIIQIPYRMRPIAPNIVADYLRSQVTVTSTESSDVAAVDLAQTQSVGPVQHVASDLPILEQSGASQESLVMAADPGVLEAPRDLSPNQGMGQAIAPNQVLQEPQDLSPTQHIDGESGPIQQEQADVLELEPSDFIQRKGGKRLEEEELAEEFTALRSGSGGELRGDRPPTPTLFQPFIQMSEADIAAQNQINSFDPETFDILVHCSEQIELTPRTGKRLINICKILQIIWNKPHPQTPTPASKTLIIAFLALSSRYPTLMRDLFAEITTELEENGISDPPDAKHPILTTTLAKLLKPIEKHQISKTNYHQKQEWRRFRGDLARMFAPNQRSIQGKNEIDEVLETDITIPRSMFNLAQSFCFIGDVGYDTSEAPAVPLESYPPPSPFDRDPPPPPRKG